MIYIVRIPEVHYVGYEVEASSKQEALDKVFDGDGEVYKSAALGDVDMASLKGVLAYGYSHTIEPYELSWGVAEVGDNFIASYKREKIDSEFRWVLQW